MRFHLTSNKNNNRPAVNILTCYVLIISVIISIFSVCANAETQPAADAVQALPTPLTLDHVLQAASESHPDLIQARADIEFNNAKLLQVDSAYGLRAYILGEARYIEPSRIALDQSNNDSKVSLVARKRLYDFGRTANAEDAALAEIQSSEWFYKDALNQYHLAVMESFFNVLLADLQFIRDNEAMSIAYINYDRTQMRSELGQRSDIELLEARSNYQQVRREVYTSQALQRSTRAKLANILNRPGELVAEIVEPKLTDHQRKIPEVEPLQQEALANNPVLKALHKQVEAAEDQLASARAGNYPFLDGEAKANEYNRIAGNYNEWEISVNMNVPLWTGGKVKAEVAQQQARLTSLRAKLRNVEMDIQQAVLENWQLLDTLRIQREEMLAQLEFRDLYLDRSRALYEMEVKTDLGDSMVQVSDARLKFAETQFKIALTWARLDALLGKPVYAQEETKK